MSILSKLKSKSFFALALLILLNYPTATMAQTKFIAKQTSNDPYSRSTSNDKYAFYTVSASNTDGGFRYTGVVREDKKTKERAVIYRGGMITFLAAYGEWLYYRESIDKYVHRVKEDGSQHELLLTGDYEFIYKGRLYFTEFDALRFYDLETLEVKTASTKIRQLDAITNDVGVIFKEFNTSYVVAQFDPETGVITDSCEYKLNGLDFYYQANIMVNNGYIYYGGGYLEEPEGVDMQGAIFRCKIGNNSPSEIVALLPKLKTGASMDMRYLVGTVMDNDCIYINYRAMSSPDNGEIWRFSLDGKVKKRVSIILTESMSKCDDWLYTMGLWTWEQRRTNINTGKQELLFRGKADNLSALDALPSIGPSSEGVVHPNSLTAFAKPDVRLYTNLAENVVDKVYKYPILGYSLNPNPYAERYYRLVDVAEMMRKTGKAFNYSTTGNTITFTTETYVPTEELKKRHPHTDLYGVTRTGYMVRGNVKKPVTYYYADGENFYSFRDILGVIGVNIDGNNLMTR